MHRNPLDRRYRRLIQQDRPLLKNDTLPPERFAHIPLLGTSALGTAGTGKTVAFDIAASGYPQVLEHCYDFERTRVSFKQVVWLKLNLFHDASLKAFGIEFFDRLGQAVGEPLRKDWGIDRRSGNTIQPLIYLAAREYNLGMLIVDEVQNMSSLHDGYQQVLNYFIRMMNCLGLPIAIIGTEAASTLVQLDLAIGRRFLGGIPAFGPFKRDRVWRAFLHEVWRLEYVRTPSDPDKLSDVVHDLTGGVPDLVIKLYALAQTRLFGRKKEEINDRVLKETAHDLFSVVADRLLELKGMKTETTGIGRVREKSDEHFAALMNDACEKIGAPPAFSAVRAGTPAEISPEEPNSSPAKCDETTSGMIAAGKSVNVKAALSKLGVLEGAS